MSQKAQAFRTLVLGGILPIIVYTVVEETYGILAGLVCGMVFGLAEVAYEYARFRKVENITLFGNGLLIAMGGISLITQDGIWFKLQPAIIEAVMAVFLMGSVVFGKPLLWALAQKQGTLANIPPAAHPFFEKAFSGLTFRVGIFFLLHAALATWAALHWSTRAWALLKGVGFTGSMVIYLIVEVFLLRAKVPALRHPERSEGPPK